MDHRRDQRENQNVCRDKWKHKNIKRNKWKWKHQDPKPVECSKNSSKKPVDSNASLPQETRKISNKQQNITHKATRKRRPYRGRKEFIKIRAK